MLHIKSCVFTKNWAELNKGQLECNSVFPDLVVRNIQSLISQKVSIIAKHTPVCWPELGTNSIQKLLPSSAQICFQLGCQLGREVRYLFSSTSSLPPHLITCPRLTRERGSRERKWSFTWLVLRLLLLGAKLLPSGLGNLHFPDSLAIPGC